MIEVKDRIPTYPGRVKMTPVAGQANTYDMVRADEPIEPGTPINRALFKGFIDEMGAIRQQIDDKIFEMSQRVRMGNLSVGSVFGLYENGVLVPFVKVASSYGDASRSLVVRKNCITADALTTVEENGYYTNCRTDLWLNNEYISMLDTATQSVLVNVSVRVLIPQFNATNIPRKVFLLSLPEYGIATGGVTIGTVSTYLTTPERRIALLDGTPVNQWTRNCDGLNKASYVTTDGTSGTGDATTVAGIRPAFTLPPDFEVTVTIPSTANTMATAEVI